MGLHMERYGVHLSLFLLQHALLWMSLLQVLLDVYKRQVIYYDGKKALIKGQIPSHFFRGLGLLKEHLETSGKDSSLTITEQPVFSRLGASFDLSRNAVMTSDALTRMFCRLALMGYQEVYLYTEDTCLLYTSRCV